MQILIVYAFYYNESRTHLSLHKDAPRDRAVQRYGNVAAKPALVGAASSLRTVLSIGVYRSGGPADDALLRPLTEVARRAVDNVGATSEKFGGCEWLTADDAEGFLDRSTLTIQRTGAANCLIFDGSAECMERCSRVLQARQFSTTS